MSATPQSMGEVDLEIDAEGLLCPLPVLRLRKKLQGLAPGAIVRLIASDPAAEIDVPHFCNEQGHAFLGSEPRRDVTVYLVRKGQSA